MICGSGYECRPLGIGSCVKTCRIEGCPPGRRCSGGVCTEIECENGNCPVPFFTCWMGLCARYRCEDVDECPEGTTCHNGLCIEDLQLEAKLDGE